MKNLVKKLNAKLLGAKMAAENFVADQRGDTNFISIAIILVVVIVIAVVFITLSQKLGGKLNDAVSSLLAALG